MNIKDSKILYELDKNSRQPLSKIAKRVGLSEQAVHYRFKHLKKTIKFFPTILDFPKLGYSLHKACFRLKNMTTEKREEIVSYLKNHNNTFWVSSSDGQFELSAAFMGKTLTEVSSYINEFNDKFINHISEQKIVNILKGEFFFRNYLTNIKTTIQRKPVGFGSTPQKARIDNTDFIILKELANNARTPSIEIAKKAHISQDNVAFRIKKLQNSGVIQNYLIAIDSEKMGLIHNKVCISLRNLTNVKQQALLDYCRDHPNIFFMNKTLGEWNMEIDFEVKSRKEFREIIMELNNLFGEIIKDYFILNIYNIHKYNSLPIKKL